MMKNYIFLLLAMFMMTTGLMSQTIQTLSPSDDTYADGGSSSDIMNTTKPEQIWIKTGSSSSFTRIAFIKFDLTGIKLEDVGTAKLRLFCYETQSPTLKISVFTSGDVNESTLTWKNRPDLNSPAVTIKHVEANAYVEWQVSTAIRGAIAQGKTNISLALSDVDATGDLARFYSKESSNANKPQLTISKEVEDYQALVAIDDAMVIGGTNADTNYGSDTGIQIKAGSSNNSFVKKGLIKFDLNTIDPNKVSSVGTARLKLYFTSTNTGTPNIDISLIPVENNWTEGAVTWNTVPAVTNNSPLRTVRIIPTEMDRYYQFDISAHVIAKINETGTDGFLSLAIEDLKGSNNGATFNSKEVASFFPVLELLKDPTTVPPDDTPITGVYYVDSVNGDDSKNGLSDATAWKSLNIINEKTFGSGARILFKKGQSWTGTLKLKGSGDPDSPIVIGSYGEGMKPILNGAGALETILLENNGYIEVRNLEITNYNPAEEGGLSMEAWEAENTTKWFDNPEAGYDLTSNTNKVGVRVTAKDIGEVNYIHLINLDIHGINGDNNDKNNGGIYMEILGSLVPTYYNDFLIEGCHIYDVDRTGVSNVSFWDNRTITDNGNWTPTLNFVVRNNVFERTGANALILRNAVDPLIEYNLFHQCAVKGSGNAAFNFNTDGAVFQYNEARFTKANVEDEDAGGLDSDFRTKNTTLQYNYLHDNDYGMLATGGGFESSFNDNTIFRYNVIERDGLVARENGEKFVFKVSGTITNTKFHNNVIYLSPEQKGVSLMLHKLWRKKPDVTEYYNNIYYIEGDDHNYQLKTSTNNVFSNNVFFTNGTNNVLPVGEDTNAITDNPLFKNVGVGPQGYKLLNNSPAIGAGMAIAGNAPIDYFENPIPMTGAIDRGTHQFSTDTDDGTPGNFSKNEFDVYLMIGQSNMAGRGEIEALDQVALERAYVFNAAGAWEKAEVPLNKYSTVRKDLAFQKLNPSYTFAKKLTEYTDRGIGLVVNARGGTKIQQWQKGYSGADDFNLYEEAVTRLKAAKGAGNFKGIIWHQGESDQSASSTYMAKLKQLVKDLRADLGTNIFVVAGEINQWREASEPINKVIRNISNDINQATYINSDDLKPINNDLDDPHFDTYSQRILGGLYADKILENIYRIKTGVATVYSKCNFEGYKVNLNPGTYNLEELQRRGIRDNDIRSLEVGKGYEVLLFTGQNDGQSSLITASNKCLTGTNVSEDVSYLIIRENDEVLDVKDIRPELINVIISPNPAKNKITINFGSNLKSQNLSDVQLIDVQGRVIKLDIGHSTKNNNSRIFDLQRLQLTAGFYFVTLTINNQIYNKKMIIE